MTDAVDCAHQKPDPDFGGECRESCKIEPVRGTSAIDARQITFRTVGHDIEGFIGPGEPPREARQATRVSSFRRQCRHQCTKPRAGETRIVIGGIVGKRDSGFFKRRYQT